MVTLMMAGRTLRVEDGTAAPTVQAAATAGPVTAVAAMVVAAATGAEAVTVEAGETDVMIGSRFPLKRS
jgi:hypothetical protein